MVDAALAVDLQLAGPHAARIRDWVESVLGWQPVDGDSGGLTPTLALTDAAARTSTSLPTVIVVDEADDAVAVAGRVVMTGARAVIVWPTERDQLPDAADRAIGRQAPADTPRALRVGGAAGGVGTTTVTLALAALAAWGGVPTLVFGRDRLPVRGVGTVAAAATGAHGIWTHATPVPGVPRLRALAVDGAVRELPPAHEAGLVVRDAGVDRDVDVLVGRRDTATLEALGETCASGLVLVEDGPVPWSALRKPIGRRLVVRVPRSNRVAAAAMAGRVPGALPGRWLGRLRPMLGALRLEHRN
ncbi:MAG: hypothetical protein R3249_07195 [Nitriliruptorales bacterium]|nr:hypothetical protein [Nitriliruptorales bacterium]